MSMSLHESNSSRKMYEEKIYTKVAILFHCIKIVKREARAKQNSHTVHCSEQKCVTIIF